MATGFMYLVAVMDWWSRYVLGWRLSNTMVFRFTKIWEEFIVRIWEKWIECILISKERLEPRFA
jgi:hypothetical protein